MSAAARIDELKKRYDENPRRFFAPLANEYRKAGDLDQAIALCQEHLADQPGNMNGHVVYGQALYEAHRYDESQATFEAALTLDPENLIALRHLGDIARANQDHVKAREWYTRVLDADPRNDEILAFIADLDVAEQQARDLAAMPRASTGTPIIPQTPVVPQTPVTPATPIRSSTPITAMPGSLEMEAVSMDFDPPAEPQPIVPDSKVPPASTVEMGLLDLPTDFGAPTETNFDDAFNTPSAAPFDIVAEDPAALPSFDEIGFDDVAPDAVVAPVHEEPMFESMEFQPPTVEHAPMDGLIDNPLFDDAPVEDAAPIEEAALVGETAPAFVTETMAELYLKQGFLTEALGVYRQLLEQNPGDERLRDKVRELDQINEPAVPPAEPIAEAVEEMSAPVPASMPTATNGTSARTFFASLAARRAAPRSNGSVATVDASPAIAEAAAPSGVESEIFADTPGRTAGAAHRVQRGGTLDALFGAEPDDNEEQVAMKFASIADGVDVVAPMIKGRPTQAASDELSLDSVFRDTPARASTVIKRQSQMLRFDQFFSPADEVAPDAAPPAPAGDPGSPAELDQFQDWLTQLKKPS
jgi:tetratricopeptide (TPR) repeat protein